MGDWTPERVLGEVLAERAQFWPAPNAAAVTEINKDLHIWLGGGDKAELLAMTRSAAEHAKAWGCDRLTLEGREGWERVLAPLGFRRVVLLVKDL